MRATSTWTPSCSGLIAGRTPHWRRAATAWGPVRTHVLRVLGVLLIRAEQSSVPPSVDHSWCGSQRGQQMDAVAADCTFVQEVKARQARAGCYHDTCRDSCMTFGRWAQARSEAGGPQLEVRLWRAQAAGQAERRGVGGGHGGFQDEQSRQGGRRPRETRTGPRQGRRVRRQRQRRSRRQPRRIWQQSWRRRPW